VYLWSSLVPFVRGGWWQVWKKEFGEKQLPLTGLVKELVATHTKRTTTYQAGERERVGRLSVCLGGVELFGDLPKAGRIGVGT
jgi:hypothetical protein